ncbi:MAG: hypothetical protein V2A73_18985 [Pseudomonadota bacterium]
MNTPFWGTDPRLVVALTAAVAMASCGPNTLDQPDASPTPVQIDAAEPDGPLTEVVLRIQPSETVVNTTPETPASIDYSASLHWPDGKMEDVTTEVVFTVFDTSLGSFSGNHFQANANRAGRTTVRAVHDQGPYADTSLTVRLTGVVVIGTGADKDAPQRFAGKPDPSVNPVIAYPPDGVLVPPNLNLLEIHFKPGGSNNLFEIAMTGTMVELKAYFGCTALKFPGEGCAYLLDKKLWDLLAQGEPGQAPITYVLRGVDTADGRVGVSEPRALSLAEEAIDGGIYYWNAGGSTVMRYEFGSREQTAETYLDRKRINDLTDLGPDDGDKTPSQTCIGCHVLSRNGERIAIGLEYPFPSIYKVYEVRSTPSFLYEQGDELGGGSNFFSFSPDAKQIMTSNGYTIVLRDATTGSVRKNNLVTEATMPDWSPDGNKLVYVKGDNLRCSAGTSCGSIQLNGGWLETIDFDGQAWKNKEPTVLVPARHGENNYYPSFSPDSAWVLFNRSPKNEDSYDAPDAELWTVSVNGGNPLRLTNATASGDSWPKWANEQAYRGGRIMWFTFSSRRRYGLRTGNSTPSQIWMTAFDPDRAAAGEDPSYPPFWLPFQDPGSGNHIGQWVMRIVR